MTTGDEASSSKKPARKTAAKKSTIAKSKTRARTKTKAAKKVVKNVATKAKTKTKTKTKSATSSKAPPTKPSISPMDEEPREKLEPPSLPAGTAMTEALGESFLNDLIANWHANGHEVIENCRTAKPDVYLRLVATYAPKEFRKRLQPFEEVPDDELKKRLERALKEIRALGLDRNLEAG